MEIKLPKSLKHISVEKYQGLYPFIRVITSESTDEQIIDAWLNIISELSGVSFEILHTQVDKKQIKKCIQSLSFLLKDNFPFVKRYMWIKGKLFRAENDVEKLNGGQYSSIKAYCHTDQIKELHNIAATAYKQFKFKHQYKDGNQVFTKYFTWAYDYENHIELSREILKKSAYDILPMVFFCSKLLKHSIESSPQYLKSQKIIEERLKEILSDESFIMNGDFMQPLTK